MNPENAQRKDWPNFSKWPHEIQNYWHISKENLFNSLVALAKLSSHSSSSFFISSYSITAFRPPLIPGKVSYFKILNGKRFHHITVSIKLGFKEWNRIIQYTALYLNFVLRDNDQWKSLSWCHLFSLFNFKIFWAPKFQPSYFNT